MLLHGPSAAADGGSLGRPADGAGRLRLAPHGRSGGPDPLPHVRNRGGDRGRPRGGRDAGAGPRHARSSRARRQCQGSQGGDGAAQGRVRAIQVAGRVQGRERRRPGREESAVRGRPGALGKSQDAARLHRHPRAIRRHRHGEIRSHRPESPGRPGRAALQDHGGRAAPGPRLPARGGASPGQGRRQGRGGCRTASRTRGRPGRSSSSARRSTPRAARFRS